MKASVTIEASVIYPLIIIFTVIMIMYSFYAHDRLSCKAQAYKALIVSHYDSAPSLDESDIQTMLKNVCLLSATYSVSCNSNNDAITITDSKNRTLCVNFTGYERCDFIRKYYTLFSLFE